MTPRLYIFDADDTLRRTRVPQQPCPHAPDEWILLPRVREVLSRIPWSPEGPFLGIASNQDHVGYGLLDAAIAEGLLRDMTLAAAGPLVPPPCIRFCPHPEAAGCDCRKPAPGMLLAIMEHFRVPPGETLFVGDADCDRLAAVRAGIAFTPADHFFGMDSESSSTRSPRPTP